MSDVDLIRRLIEGSTVDEAGCWNWDGWKTHDGYGIVSISDRNHVVHRVLYEQLVGTVPDGLDLDHLCRNRACCNPRHVEPTTRSENLRRGLAGRYVMGGTCRKGHRLTPDTLLVKADGGHRCRTCRRAVTARYEEKRRAAAAA